MGFFMLLGSMRETVYYRVFLTRLKINLYPGKPDQMSMSVSISYMSSCNPETDKFPHSTNCKMFYSCQQVT